MNSDEEVKLPFVMVGGLKLAAKCLEGGRHTINVCGTFPFSSGGKLSQKSISYSGEQVSRIRVFPLVDEGNVIQWGGVSRFHLAYAAESSLKEKN